MAGRGQVPGVKMSARRQTGIALLETLIALAILAGALLGLLYAQMRTLAATESALRRTQALGLIDDLAERIRANPSGLGEMGLYRIEWGAPPAPGVDCESRWCNPEELARWDLAQWKRNLARALPQGDAQVFDPPGLPAAAPRRMLGVMVGWHSRVGEEFEVSVPGATCPTGHVCQFGHVQP